MLPTAHGSPFYLFESHPAVLFPMAGILTPTAQWNMLQVTSASS
nr:hypothetical protein Q903MT_gene6188 [Picea sitchensis]